MDTIVMTSNTIELPPQIAEKLHGKILTIEETNEGLLLKYENDAIAKTREVLYGQDPNSEKQEEIQTRTAYELLGQDLDECDVECFFEAQQEVINAGEK